MGTNTKWKSQKGAFEEALSYVYGRRKGIIKSFKTPWKKLNEAGVNGLEWNSMTVFGGRPGSGKTLIKDQIIRHAFENNPEQDMRVLEFSFEMVARASKVREFSAVLGKPYKYICSASDNPKEMITQEDFLKLKAYAEKMVDIDKYPIDIVENPTTVPLFKKIVEDYMETNAAILDDGRKKYVNTVMTIDHSLLFKLTKGDASKTNMLMNLGETITELKRRYPIAWIVLSQLGRDVESHERNENGKYGNYILQTDLYGGDALFQHADMVIGINKPADKNITEYGTERLLITDPNTLVWHFLKTRMGDTRISFFEAQFHKMRVVEAPTPPSKKGR